MARSKEALRELADLSKKNPARFFPEWKFEDRGSPEWVNLKRTHEAGATIAAEMRAFAAEHTAPARHDVALTTMGTPVLLTNATPASFRSAVVLETMKSRVRALPPRMKAGPLGRLGPQRAAYWLKRRTGQNVSSPAWA